MDRKNLFLALACFGGALALSKTGTGNQTLGGASTYAGKLSLAAGSTLELASADATRRLVAFRALRAAGRDVFALCQSAATDASPAVRREVALALRDFRTPAAVATLVTVAKGFDGKDRAYLAALGLGAIDRETEVYAALAKELGAAPADWSPAFAALTWRLHPPQSVAGVRERLLSGQLTKDEAKVALTGLAFTKSAAAATTMVELALDKNFVHRELANWWLALRQA